MENLQTSESRKASAALQLSRPISERLLAEAMAWISGQVDAVKRDKDRFGRALSAIRDDPLCNRHAATTAKLTLEFADQELAYATKTVEVSATLVQALLDEIIESDPIVDRAVGIDQSDGLQLIYELRLWLDGKQVCPRCGGEGYIFNQEQYERERAAEQELGDGYENPDSGMQACLSCESAGVVGL